MRYLVALLAFVALPAWAAPFLVSDPVPAVQGSLTITHCSYARGILAPTFHPVEAVTGGVRCRIDLAADSKTGTVTVGFRDNAAGITGPTTSYTFATLPAPGNLRLVP